MSSPRLILILSTLMVFVACQKTGFKGGNSAFRGNQVPRKEPVDLSNEYQKENPNVDIANDPNMPKPGKGVDPKTGLVPGNGKNPINTDHLFQMSCGSLAEPRVEFKESVDRRVSATLRGQICPESTDKLHLLFLVDFSGSMGPHYDDDEKKESAGHDEVINGSCGRLDVARQIIESVKARAETQGGTNSIQVTFIPFAGDAIEELVMSEGLDNFSKAYLTKEHFCRYVAQDSNHTRAGQSLKLNDKSITAQTNYAAAFQRAQKALQNAAKTTSNTEMYFISDGEPTSPGDVAKGEPLAAAEKAGKALREDKSVKNTTINGLYLGIKGTQTYEKAAGVLAKVTGSPDRVLPAEQASQLAARIADFPKADINLDETKYGEMASVFVEQYGEKPVGIQYLKEVSAGVWEYETQPFLLLGIPGKKVDNRVNINIFSPDGFLFKTQVHIDYTQL